MIAAGKRYIVYPSRSDRITLVYFSDIHWMARACAEDEVRKTRDAIKDDPYSFWIGGGDYGEFIGTKDEKRFDPSCVASWVSVADLGRLGKVCAEQIRDLFKPIKHKCLGLLTGNHEYKYGQHNAQQDLHGWICTELGVPNLGYCCLMDAIFYRTQCKRPTLLSETPKDHSDGTTKRIFAHHGSGAAQSKGGKVNRMVKFMHDFDADIYFMGHVHDDMDTHIDQLGANADCTKLIQKKRYGFISGSYLKTYDQNSTTYGERAGYSPVSIGSAKCTINPLTGEIVR